MADWLAQHLIAQGVPESRALNILSLGFALGLLIGRVVVSQVLRTVPAETVTLAASILMAITTFWMLRTTAIAGIAVFLAGVAMAPMFPTVLAIVANRFPWPLTATASGIAISSGWLGLLVSLTRDRIHQRAAIQSGVEESVTGDSSGIGRDDRCEPGAASPISR